MTKLACGTLIVVALATVQGAGARGTVARGHDVIAFVRFSARSGHPRIYTVSPRGAKPRLLRLPVSAAAGPAWSRGGRRLAFIGGQNAPNANSVTVGDELYVAAANGSRARRLTYDAAHEAGPSWAPDGKRIVFLRSRPGSTRSSLWIMGRNGRRARRLTYGTIDLEPSWAPGGRWIAFLRINPKTYHSGIWLVRPDGSGLRRILRGLKHASDPVWSPDGSHLLLTNGKALLVVARDGSGRRTLAKLSTDA